MKLTHRTYKPVKKAAVERPWADHRERSAWIQYQLRLRGQSIRRLAQGLGLSHSAVRAVIAGATNRFVEADIARILGVDPVWLFHEHYGPDGSRLSAQRPMRRALQRSAA